MKLKLPELSLVLMVGTSSSGKSSFAKKHFGKYEVVSSDECRGIVSNDIEAQSASKDAFDLLHYTIEKRMKNALLTVVDATNLQQFSRKKLIDLARKYHFLPTAIVLNTPLEICEARHATRTDRNFGKQVLYKQNRALKRTLKDLKKERYARIHILNSPEEADAVTGVEREKLYNNLKHVRGAFDLIGDIHGCYKETLELLKKLGYVLKYKKKDNTVSVTHPEGRKVIFVGDLVDRGPNSPAVLRLVMGMVKSGIGYCVCGNHDFKLKRKLDGRNVKLTHGLAETMEQLKDESPAFLEEVRVFLQGLISHYVFDDGKLVVAHAGLKEAMHGRASGAIRNYCMFGETTGEVDEYGLPIRLNWAADYRGEAMVVYGHTPVYEAEWLNNTIDIDTGCVFGHKLTALRYPERELVEVDAHETYAESKKPLVPKSVSEQQTNDDLLDIEDVTGKRTLQTRLLPNIKIWEENSIAALEVMSRFALNPKWLIYLPPTMSPSATSALENYLEHPKEAIQYYKKRGVERVICEEKHMGSRVVLVICKNTNVPRERFGIHSTKEERIGVCYTRTGRNFFTDEALEMAFLQRIQKALTASGFWEKFDTDWVCLDAELMPWSAKAQALLRSQYAAVGAAATPALTDVESTLQATLARGIADVEPFLDKFGYKRKAVEQFKTAYRGYCWEVNSLEDFKLAPFHILATEGEVHTNKNHVWHMQNIQTVCEQDLGILRATPYYIVSTQDEASVQQAIDWWHTLTEKGGEGMVVKPYDFIVKGKKGILQPAVKCRGKEYLRIIYGPAYDMPEYMTRLKKRGLGKKRKLALREFALGVEALERFVRKEPLRRVHECVFGVLAMESEAVDPRL